MDIMNSSFRPPANKAVAPLFSSQLEDLFERYIDSDPFDLSSSDNTAERSSSDDFANALDLPESPVVSSSHGELIYSLALTFTCQASPQKGICLSHPIFAPRSSSVVLKREFRRGP